MSTTSQVIAGVDTHVRAAAPSKNYQKGAWLRVQADQAESLVRFKSPAPAGATILSAKLHLTQQNAVTGSHTLDVQRVETGFAVTYVRWDSKPSAVGASATLTKTGTPAGTEWVVDVTNIYQSFSGGNDNHGLRIRSNGTTELRFWSLNAAEDRPWLEVVWTTAPAAPTILSPDGGFVGTAFPVVSSDYTDNAGNIDLTSLQVQIGPDETFVDVWWDSGEVFTSTPVLDLAAAGYFGLTADQLMFWRMRVRDGDGLWSAWSDAAEMTYSPKMGLTITSPSSGGTVAEFTPPITWTVTGQQTHFRVTVRPAANPTKLLHDSGKVLGSVTAYTLPEGVLRDLRQYLVDVYVWDSVARESTVGQPTYSRFTQPFSVVYSSTVAPPDWLFLETDSALGPVVRLMWQRSAGAPDGWVVLRDGLVVAELTVAETLNSGLYYWSDFGARVGRESQWEVRAVVNGVTSAGSGANGIAVPAEGIWLMDVARDLRVQLGGMSYDGAATDQGEAYQPVGGGAAVRVVTGLNGMQGTVTDGILRDRPDLGSVYDLEEALLRMKANPLDTYRLAIGDLNIPVTLGNLSIMPSPATIGTRVIKAVAFDWYQAGEFAWEEYR